MADAREVAPNGVWFDMVAHVNSEEAECIRGWFKRVVMHFYEVEL